MQTDATFPEMQSALDARECGLWNRFGKRAFDFTASLAGLIVLSPLLLLAAIAVKLEDGGPVLFMHERVGRGFRPFKLLKFRSMITDAASRGLPVTAGGDSRVTRVGRVLRKTKMDELPQLVNVLVGDISLVGPRPEVARYVERFPAEYAQILKFRPGITDYASITYRDEERVLAGAEDVEMMYVSEVLPTKLRLNFEYLGRMGFVEDVKIILRTFLSL